MFVKRSSRILLHLFRRDAQRSASSAFSIYFFSVLSVLSVVLFYAPRATAPTKQPLAFTLHSAHTGPWTDPQTWTEHRTPRANDLVQIRPTHTITYDASSDEPIRLIHVAGTLTFSREKSTRLTVGLIKV